MTGGESSLSISKMATSQQETGRSGLQSTPLQFNYNYQPLKDNQIRVLKLFPATKPEDGLAGELHHVELNPEIECEAVSYVWGQPVFPVVLTINDS